MLSLDLQTIKDSCYKLNEVLGSISPNDKHNPMYTTRIYSSYNAMLFPFDGFHDLYFEIQNMFHDAREQSDITHKKFYMQSWLNIFRSGESLGWHMHWEPEHQGWHGFYCVQVGQNESRTSYKWPPSEEQIDIESVDNLLVISKTDGDRHRSSPWLNKSMDRITIAFDIVPDYVLRDYGVDKNHWIPL
jgi:hypothetical protein